MISLSKKVLAWVACHELVKIWHSKLSQKIKIRLFVATVESVLLYGSESWIFDKSMQKQQDGYYTRMLRMALNVSWKQHLTNEQLYRNLPLVSFKVRQRRLRLSGHCIKKRLHNTSYYGSQNFEQLVEEEERLHMLIYNNLLDDTGHEDQ